MEKKERIVVGAALALVLYTVTLNLLGPIVYSALTNKTISSTGSIIAVGVGVYSDPTATNPISSINWGTLEPGSNVNKTIYIQNEGNTPVTLSMATSNWNPTSASSYMTLSWDYGGQEIDVDEVVPVKLTLSVSASITGITNFSFDITITATSP